MIFNKKHSKLTRAEKSMLWSQISETIAEHNEPVVASRMSLFSLFITRYKFALASFLVVALLGSSAGVVSASNKAVPGDALFPIDTAIEKIQLMFSRGNKKNTLRIKFAEERLKEVKTVLALENNTNAATENDSTSTTTTETTSENTSAQIIKSETALLVALAHLEKEKDKLESSGNSSAAAIIANIIAELNDLAQNHVQHLNKLALKIETKKNNGIKIAFEASSNSVTTKFKFEQKENGKPNNASQRGNGRFKFESNIENDGDEDGNESNDEDENGDDDEDNDDDDNKKGKKNSSGNQGRIKVNICHKPDGDANTIRVASAAARAHLSHGDTLGVCDINEDDDEDNDDDATTTPDTTLPIISNLSTDNGTATAEISWNTDELASSKIWYSNIAQINTENDSFMNSDALTINHSMSLTSLSASTTYYYIVSSTDEAGNTATSSETSFTTLAEEDTEPIDIVAPVISNIEITATTTSAEVTWNTDEASNSIVWYSTTTPVDTENDSSVSTDTLTINHVISLTSLLENTTYYIVISSTDEALNKAEYTETSFTTPEEFQEPEDTTPPVISNISAISTTTSATISWTTDEEATSKVWYGTTTPLVITNETFFEEDGSFNISHSLTLAGLTASTTYYYIVSSTDTTSNISDSSEDVFVTSP